MAYLFIAILTLAAISFIAYPMVSKRRYLHRLEDLFDLGDTKRLNYLHGKKASILDNIRELDFEYEMGKLSEEDYTRLREGYLKEAHDVVGDIDGLKIKEEIEELIESEVRSRRRIQ